MKLLFIIFLILMPLFAILIGEIICDFMEMEANERYKMWRDRL